MRSYLAIASLLAATVFLSGCPLVPTCGGFNGGGDKVYTHGTELLIECENGGYVMTLADGNREGRLSPDRVTGEDGATGAKAFDLVTSPDGTLTALGRTWTVDDMNATGLDHADVLCSDLTTRSWWAAMSTLPQATAFGKTAGGFASVADCQAAQANGSYPANAACQDQLLLCPDGSDFIYTGDVVQASSYSDAFGAITTGFGTSGTFADGTFSDGTTWTQIDVSSVAGAIGACP